jgi:DNA-binding CsgD family transcriptional regulator
MRYSYLKVAHSRSSNHLSRIRNKIGVLEREEIAHALDLKKVFHVF